MRAIRVYNYNFQLYSPWVLAHTVTAPNIPEAHHSIAFWHTFSSTLCTDTSKMGAHFTPTTHTQKIK